MPEARASLIDRLSGADADERFVLVCLSSFVGFLPPALAIMSELDRDGMVQALRYALRALEPKEEAVEKAEDTVLGCSCEEGPADE